MQGADPTHKTKFLRPFLGSIQSGGALNPQLEISRVNPSHLIGETKSTQVF